MQVNKQIRYVAVGDSYTVGEGVGRDESWPALLAADLQKNNIPADLIANIAKTGWLTEHVIELELPLFEKYGADFATLLIGANDWVQEVSAEKFANNFQKILDKMQSSMADPKKIILLTIPDFSVTQVGQIFGTGRNIVQGILEFNEIIIREAQMRSLPLVDVFPLSSGMKDNPELVALDGLHPSGKEYALWEKEIFPVALKLLTEI